MDLSKVFEVAIGAVAAWVVLLEMRFQKSQAKVMKLEEKSKDDAITDEVHFMPDAELDDAINKRLGSPKT